MTKEYIITIKGESAEIARELERIAALIEDGTEVGRNSHLEDCVWQFISEDVEAVAHGNS